MTDATKLEMLIENYIVNEAQIEKFSATREDIRLQLGTLCPNGYENDRINIFWKEVTSYKHPKTVEKQIADLKASIKKIEEMAISSGLSKVKGVKRTMNISVR